MPVVAGIILLIILGSIVLWRLMKTSKGNKLVDEIIGDKKNVDDLIEDVSDSIDSVEKRKEENEDEQEKLSHENEDIDELFEDKIVKKERDEKSKQ